MQINCTVVAVVYSL